MTRDGDITTIFNPRRNRTPSVLVTDETAPSGTATPGGAAAASAAAAAATNPAANTASTAASTTGGGTSGSAANGPFTHADSVTSSQPDGNAAEQQSPATPSGLTAKYKSCSDSLCSSSARKVSNTLYINKRMQVCVTKLINLLDLRLRNEIKNNRSNKKS